MAKKKTSKELTIKEKCHLVHGYGNWHIHGVKRLGIEGIELHDGPFGLRKTSEGERNLYNSEPATCFPAPSLLACSWDEDLERRIGVSLGQECAAKGTSLLLTPGVNIKRNPLCGRNFEYFSEDPLLAGKMAASFIAGIQSQKVGACIKHFACNSQESYRNISDSLVDERALNELYLKPFEIAVKESKPWSLMASYNLVNGVHASDNEYLLIETLRDRWHYDGVVMSDWGGTFDPVLSHNHGLDLEMPCLVKGRTRELRHAARRGVLKAKKLGDSAYRIADMLQKAADRGEGHWNPDESHTLAVEAAEKSMVLLANRDNILPLSSFRGACVIGAFAKTPRYQGNGSSFVRSERVVSFLDAVDSLHLPYAQGYSLEEDETDAELSLNAADLASKSKNVILFLGLPDIVESEGYDRKDINLPNNQLSLFDRLYAVNQNIIVVLSCGAPVALPFVNEAKAILLSYLGGEGSGEAVRDLLLGTVSPSGKLAETWPLHLADVPSFGFYPGYEAQSLYKESIYVGYRYYCTAQKKVAFPFGHGLSYAKFTYGLELSKKEIHNKEICLASVTVGNRSKRDCETVVELYAEASAGNVFKPKRTLIAFKKVHLQPSSTVTVDFPLTLSTFAHYDTKSHDFGTEGGTYKIQVGESCENIRVEKALNVVSEKTFPSLRASCPMYYEVSPSGFSLCDDDFETLLGEVPSLPVNRHERPFNMDSTMEEISQTKIGRTIHKAFFKHAFTEDESSGAKAMITASFEDTPIRGMASGGLSSKMIQAILDYANGRYVAGFLHMIFGKRKKNK